MLKLWGLSRKFGLQLWRGGGQRSLPRGGRVVSPEG